MRPSQAGLLDGTHAVLTPEYVEFDFVLAGLYSRFLAWLFDRLLILVAAFAVGIMIQFFGAAAGVVTGLGDAAGGFSAALYAVLYFLADWGYSITLETVWSGQTVGKRIMGLRVIQESGVRIGFYQSVLRNLARAFDGFPAFLYLVGGTVALFSNKHQRLGDMLAGTVVIRDRKLKPPSSVAQPEGEMGLLADPMFVSRAHKLPADDQEVLFQAALRREELSIDARLKLFAALSERLQTEFGFYKPEHLSDEKLVLLVATIIVNEKRRARTRAKAR